MSFVELMVAIVILAVGVLGLGATADSTTRALTRAGVRAQAAARAGMTVDSLRGHACRISGSASGSNGEQSWTVNAYGSGRFILDTVAVRGRRFTVEGVVVCP